MRVVTVIGTRPQLIKVGALQPVLRRRVDEVFVDTGQHWDDNMAGSFFTELGLARPDFSLGTGGGSHAQQTAAMLVSVEPILARERTDAVIVVGDTNSTLAAALAAAKLDLPVAHVEAGLRAFDRRIPEELNRVVVDHLAQLLFAPTQTAVQNLRAEGIVDGVSLTGDLMQDLAASILPSIRDPAVLGQVGERLGLELRPGGYLFVTIHRASNREPAAIAAWTSLLAGLARPDRRVIVALHPGTRAALARDGASMGAGVTIIEPQGYRTTATSSYSPSCALSRREARPISPFRTEPPRRSPMVSCRSWRRERDDACRDVRPE
jgi:UDP-N-acetylglucosamine 2-epimerase